MKLTRNFLLPKNHVVLGMDIGSRMLKLLALKELSVGHYEVVVATKLSFAPNIMQGKALINPKALGALIKTAIQSWQLKINGAIAALPNNFIISKTISLAKNLTDMEIEQHILLESERYFGCAASEIGMDFSLLDNSNAFVVAGKRVEIEARVKALQISGLKVKAIEVNSLALLRTAKFFSQKHNVILIHLEDYSFLIAATMLHANTIAEKQWDSWPTLAVIFEEIKYRLELFLAPEIFKITEIQLTGDYADLESLQILIQQQFGLATTVLKHSDAIKINNPQLNLAGFALSLGLALWYFQ